MTIEEKAKEYANENINAHNIGLRGVLKATGRSTFTAGANWMLEKAVNFIRQHDSEMIVCHTEDDNDNFIAQFKKAMEE